MNGIIPAEEFFAYIETKEDREQRIKRLMLLWAALMAGY